MPKTVCDNTLLVFLFAFEREVLVGASSYVKRDSPSEAACGSALGGGSSVLHGDIVTRKPTLCQDFSA